MLSSQVHEGHLGGLHEPEENPPARPRDHDGAAAQGRRQPPLPAALLPPAARARRNAEDRPWRGHDPDPGAVRLRRRSRGLARAPEEPDGRGALHRCPDRRRGSGGRGQDHLPVGNWKTQPPEATEPCTA